MATFNEQRQGEERRRQPRGGRRTTDVPGYAPMVLVVDENSRTREISEAILVKLRFAVAPFESVDKALSVMQGLRPDIVVAGEREAERLRDSVPHDRHGLPIPIVTITEHNRAADALVEAVRRALREHQTQIS